MASCPKCGFAIDATTVDCPACGIVIAKFRHVPVVAPGQPPTAVVPPAPPAREATPPRPLDPAPADSRTTKPIPAPRPAAAAPPPPPLPPSPPPPRPGPTAPVATATPPAEPGLSDGVATAAARAKTVAVLVYLNVAAALAGIATGCQQVIVIERAAAGLLSEQEANAHDRLYGGVGIAQLVLVLIAGFLWLRWLHRAYANLGAVGHRTSRFTPGWAVGYWFVPIVNLWRPYQVHRDLAARSRAGNALTEEEVRAAKTPLVDGWWAIWIFASLLGNVSGRLAMKAETLPQLRTVTWLALANDALVILAALLALRLLRGVTTAQQRWLARETSPIGPAVELAAAPAQSLAGLPAGAAVPLSTGSEEAATREPCFHCKEPARLDARVCPHCRHSLLVDVHLDAPIEDPRDAYGAARTIAELVPGRDLGAVRLGIEQGTLALGGISRHEASLVLAALGDAGAGGRAVVAAAGGEGAQARPQSRSQPHPQRRLGRLVWRIAAALAVLALAGVVAWWSRRAPSASEIEAAAKASTVSLRCAGVTVGSGFFVTPTRLVTDATSLCADQTVEVVLADGRRLAGRAVELDWRIGLALVSAPDAQAEPLELGDATSVRRGDAVYFFGQPDTDAGSLARTVIGDEAFPLRGIPYLQFHGTIDPEHAGGPLLDERGQVVGIVTTKPGDTLKRSRLALPVSSLVTRHDGWALQAAPRMDEQIWAQRLARAEEGDRSEALIFIAKVAPRSVVKSAIVRDRSILEVFVVRRSQERPRDSAARIELVIGHGGLPRCRTSGSGRCQPIAEIGPPWWDPSIGAWLASHGLDCELWGAVYRVRLGEGCPSAYNLEMVPIYPVDRPDDGARIELEPSSRSTR